jgi:hypothetical protein
VIRRIKVAQIKAIRQEFLDAQQGRCAICMIPIASGGGTLDHDHKSGYLRAILCTNCNGIEGKVLSLARRGQRKYDPVWFLKRLTAYWETHNDAQPEHGLLHPTFKTDDEKRLRANKKARERRAAAKG